MRWRYEGGPWDGLEREAVRLVGDGLAPETQVVEAGVQFHLYRAIAGTDEVILYKYDIEESV